MRSLLNVESAQSADEKIVELEQQAIKDLTAEEKETEAGETKVETQVQQEESEEKKAEEVEDPEAEKTQEDTKDTNANAKEDLSKKGQDRMQQLANDRNKLAADADRVPELEKELKRLRGLLGVGTQNPGRPSNPTSAPQNATPLPWQQGADGENRELTPEELQAMIKTESAAQVANQRILDTLNYDIATVTDSYPELRAPTDDSPNPDFDEQLTANITKWYETLFKDDHSMRFSDFVNQIMSLKAKGEERGKKLATAEASDVLKQQDAEQAIDTSGSPAGKPDQDLETKIRSAKSSKDLAELEALLPHGS